MAPSVLSSGSSQGVALRPCAPRVLAVSLMAVIAMIMSLVMGLVMLRGAGLATQGAALGDCVSGPQAHNYDAPGQPPPRLLDAELRKDSEDDGDDFISPLDLVDELPELAATIRARLELGERRSDAVQRAREGHGARGPPVG